MTIFNSGLQQHKLNYCRELLYGKCFKKYKDNNCWCRSVRKSRMERLFDQGRTVLKKEMDVVDFFKELRELKAKVKMKLKFTKEEQSLIN